MGQMSELGVVVRWIDSIEVESWVREKELPKPEAAQITTLGKIVREGPDAVVVAATVSTEAEGDDPVYIGVLVIPRIAIQSITPIQEVPQRLGE